MASRGILGAGSIPFIGCVVLLVAIFLHILAFASPAWASDDYGKFGLWRTHDDYCTNPNLRFYNTPCRYWADNWEDADWFKAVQALEMITIIFWVWPLIILPVYIYVAMGLYYKCLMGTMTAFTFLGAATNIAGLIIFGIEIETTSNLSHNWCLPVCAAGGLLGFLAFIIFLVACLNRPKFVHEQHFLSGFYADPDKNRMYVVENVEPPAASVAPSNSVKISPAQVVDSGLYYN
ncbi:hypothetical protein EGW08_015139 [Elysia chlorotica]|uniref:Uncharacterized protein n=1 Tax=Elysia chlorotica TaxID=188477 RepID=A0A433T6N1_ELYCH|nr:hypothetical protein EGW08_015139 [Elysia chlorotica]